MYAVVASYTPTEGSAPLTCEIDTILILSEGMESMRRVTICHLDNGVVQRGYRYNVVSKGFYRDHGAQRSADRDGKQGRIHDHADEERHGCEMGRKGDGETDVLLVGERRKQRENSPSRERVCKTENG